MRYTQPQSGPAQIDPSIGADFAWCAPLGGFIGPKVTAGTSSRSATPAGIGIKSGYAVVAASVPSMHATTWTECGVLLLDGTNTVVTLSARGRSQAAVIGPTNVNLVMWGVADVNIGGTVPTGIVHYVFKRSGSAHTVWFNGKLFGTISNASAPSASDGTLPAVGSHAGSTGNAGLNSLVATTGALSVIRTPKALSDAQCLSLSWNHWRIFKSPQRVMAASAAPVGGASYTLPAAQGSFTITGNAANLRVARRMLAAAGSYALTGAAAGLRAGRRTAAAQATYTLTGNPIAMRAARRMTAALGSYSLTGNAVALVKSSAGMRTLSAAGGSYTITGRAANLRAARRMVAAPGAYTLTGFATVPPAVAGLAGTIEFRRLRTKPTRVLRLA